MYKIVVDEKMPETCKECGLYCIYEDDYSPAVKSVCRITGQTIDWVRNPDDTLPEWCPIEGSVPKHRTEKKLTREQRQEIDYRRRRTLAKIVEEWDLEDWEY